MIDRLCSSMPVGERQRILLTSDYLPPSDGGVEQVVQKLAIRLISEGFEVGVFTLDTDARNIELRQVPEISVYTASAVDLTDVVGLQSTFSLAAIRKFGNVLRDFRPDIVHAHNRFFYATALASLYTLRANYKLITTLHLGDIGRVTGLGGGVAKIYEQTVSRFVLSRSDCVICVSEASESIAKSLGAKHTVVVRNGVDVDEFSPNRMDKKSLLYIGRFVRNNGIQSLTAALPRILDAHPDAEVHLVGSGPLEREVEETIRSAGISDAVTVYDYVEDISEMYDLASVFCRPSHSEGLPLTMLEAMAAGVPPVVTGIAGVPEVISDHETGILLEPGKPDEIARAVSELFDNPELRESLAKSAREYVMKNLSWEQRTDKVIDVYSDVADDD